jgi:hypothetical protein
VKPLNSKGFDAFSGNALRHGETCLGLLRIRRFQVQLLMGAPGIDKELGTEPKTAFLALGHFLYFRSPSDDFPKRLAIRRSAPLRLIVVPRPDHFQIDVGTPFTQLRSEANPGITRSASSGLGE